MVKSAVESAIQNGQSVSRSPRSILLGAASLMATSAIGPGFLTQTAVFTAQFQASFGCAIALSVVIGLAAQLNVWRVIGVSGMRGQEIADTLYPGLGRFIALLVGLGGLAFNIGNIAGAGLGLNALCGLDLAWGAALSAVLSLALFLKREFGGLMDSITKFLGAIMIVLTVYVAVNTHPPLGEAVFRTFVPQTFSLFPVITLVGGTVGGYISFSGAHRLLDAGVAGRERIREISRSAVTAISIVSLMRLLLFLAFWGVVAGGVVLDPANPPASAFRAAAGEFGFRTFGIVLWCAALSSVVGASYTSVSFLRTLHGSLESHRTLLTAALIVIPYMVFAGVGQPVKLLIWVGALNGVIFPLTLGVILIAAKRKDIVGGYRHPKTLLALGYVSVLAGIIAIFYSLRGLVELWR